MVFDRRWGGPTAKRLWLVGLGWGLLLRREEGSWGVAFFGAGDWMEDAWRGEGWSLHTK